jgi:hypothetical protein
VKQFEALALVFMNALNLNIEQALRIHRDIRLTSDITRKILLDLLGNNPELITYPGTNRGNLQSRHGTEEAGGETTQTAIAQTRVQLLPDHFLEIQSEFPDGLFDIVTDTKD